MHIKRKQLNIYVPGTTRRNLPATLETQTTSRRRATTDDDEAYMNSLKTQFRHRIIKHIKTCHDENESFDDLYKTLMQLKQLPRGVVSSAEQSINAPVNSIVVYLNRVTRTTKKKSIEHWKDYVKENFESLKDSVTIQEESTAAQEGVEEQEEVDEEEPEEIDDNEVEDDVAHRTCSTSFSSVIRKDLPQNCRSTFIGTINKTIEQASDYLADFSKQVMKMLLLFKDNQFITNSGNIQLVHQEGQSLNPVLPVGYLHEDVIVPKPLNSQFLQTDSLKEEYNALFQEAHFDQIHSTYFGSKGISKSTLNTARLHKAIVNLLGRDEENVYNDLSSHVMKMARNVYIANFMNMWADNTIVNKALNRLLNILLIVHLSPARDQEFKKKREELKGKNKGKNRQPPNNNCAIPVNSMSLINKTYNGRRRLFADEIKRRNRYIEKGGDWVVKQWKASLCQQRLNSYADVLQREKQKRQVRREQQRQQEEEQGIKMQEALVEEEIQDVDMEDILVEEDTSRKRINQLKQITRAALFEEKTICKAYFVGKLSNISDKEVEVILKIIKFVKPYMASRATYHVFSHQIPFLLMVNQVLRSVGYHGQVVKLSPIIRPTNLHALWIDATTLHSLFCARKLEHKMVLHDFEGNVIRAASVTSQKDAVFSSFFDIDRLKTICAGYGLQFAYRMHVLPGLQCVRILGTRNYQKHKQKNKQQPPVTQTSTRSNEINSRIAALIDQKITVEKRLKNAQITLNKYLLGSESASQLKKKWNDENIDRDSLHKEIQVAKKKKRQLIQEVVKAKQELSSANNDIYKQRYDATSSAERRQIIPVEPNKPCHHKVEECIIDQKVDKDQLVFSGTDNGIINVTETVAFGVDRLKYHLRLYNRFQVLQDQEDAYMEEKEDAQLKKLPTSFKVRSAALRQHSGLASFSSSLNRRKRLTVLGQNVADLESDLSESSIQQCGTIDELDATFTRHSQAKSCIRQFYFSRSSANKKRRLELTKNRFYDRLASKERKFTKVSSPIMFIGDRGHAIRSPIKGHLRFGGYWKELRHSRYTPTLITNEHNSSQTCLWCFSKLSHPYTAKDGTVKKTNGSFICLNDVCPNKSVVMSRDCLSALAIGLAGAAQLMLGYTFPCFDPKNTTAKQAMFSQLALVFSDRKQQTSWPSVGGSTTRASAL